MKMTITGAALAAAFALTACGGSDADNAAATAAPVAAAPVAAASPQAKPALPTTPVNDTAVGKSMPAANGKPSPDTIDQKANDLIACEAGRAAGPGKPPVIAVDAFEKAKARLSTDPQALEKCRAG